MKASVIFYHSNIGKIYKQEWIDQCINSIYRQSYKQFDIYELNYGDCSTQYTKGEFHKIPMKNHIYAMNYLLDMLFTAGYDVIFNTNMDDFYSPNRFDVQMNAIYDGYQLISSNFRYINGKAMLMSHKGDLGKNLAIGHNIIAHPVIAMHRSFWDTGLRYIETQLGHEDLNLWQRAYKCGIKFHICKDILLNYRIHDKQVGRLNK